MKRILLLFIVCFGINATAQQANTQSKATSGIDGGWFCFAAATAAAGVSEYNQIPVYPDSNLFTGSDYWSIHGIGVSLDPKSIWFDSNYSMSPYPLPSFLITDADPYTVDSIGIVGRYDRIDNNVVDTLYIYLTYTVATGTFNEDIHFPGPVDTCWGKPDSSMQFSTATYDWPTNSINPDSVAPLIKITKLLDAAAYADTAQHITSNGAWLHQWSLEVPGGLNVPAGGHVVGYVTFGSANNHPLGTNINNANKWNQWMSAVNGQTGVPSQYVGDYNCGLAAFTEERYHLPGYWRDSATGSAILAPMYLCYNDNNPSYPYVDPWFGVFAVCSTCTSTYVPEVVATSFISRAYPSPAANEVNITFTSKVAGKANISITNTLGQVVDSKVLSTKANEVSTVTFPTATLANGIYFYTIEANGYRHTNRFVVAH